MSLMTNEDGKILTNNGKAINKNELTILEVDDFVNKRLRDLGVFDTESTQEENRKLFAQAVYKSSGSFAESKGTLYIGQLGAMKIPVFAQCMSGYGNVFIYESAEGAKSYFNKYLYNVTGGKVLLMGDYSSYSKNEIDEVINNKVYDLNQRIDDAYMELESMIEESRNEIEDRENLISIIGAATETLAGVMSANDKKNLNTLVALIQNDENNVVDTINEVLAIFEQYPEGANLVELLGGKVDKIDVYTKPEIDEIFENAGIKKNLTIAQGAPINVVLSKLFTEIKNGTLTLQDSENLTINKTYNFKVSNVTSTLYVIELSTLNGAEYITSEAIDISGDVPSYVQYTSKMVFDDLYLPKLQITGIGGSDEEVVQQLMYYLFEQDTTTFYLINNTYYGKMTKNTGPGIVINIHRIYDGTEYSTAFNPSTINSYEDIPVTTTSYYNKDTVDNLLLYKADKADTYSKSQIDSFNSQKVDKTTYESKVEELEENISDLDNTKIEIDSLTAKNNIKNYQEVLWLGSDEIPEIPTQLPFGSSTDLITFLEGLKNLWSDIDSNLIEQYGYNRVVFLGLYGGKLVKVDIAKASSGNYNTRVHSSVYKTNVKECISLNTNKRYKLVNDTYTTIQEPSYFLEEFKIDNVMSLETNHNHIIMNPNVYYIIDSQVAPNLTFTLLDYDPKETSVYREYMGEIRVDENPVTAIIDERIRWNTAEGVTIEDHIINLEAKKTYLFSILNYIGLISSISNPQLDAPVLTLEGSVLSWDAINNAKTYRVYTPDNDLSMLSTTQIDLQNYITNPGVYTVYVEAKDNYYTDNVNSIEYVISTTLATPTNLVINESNTLSWDSVENASSYLVTLKETSSTKTVTTNLCDLTTFTELSTAGTYTFEVNAIGDNKVYLTSSASTTITVTIPEV